MLEGVQKIPTIDMTRDQWLAIRRESIGGSDAAAIAGLNEWASPYSVWADKTGRLEEMPDNEAMRQGRDLEEYVARRWCETTGKKVKRVNAILRRRDYPFAHANVDRWVVGENAGLECKTTSVLRLKAFQNGQYPDTYYAQCVHYMAVTGADRWYLAVLVLGKDFCPFVIERNEEEIDALMRMEQEFWNHVEQDTPPPVDGTEATTGAIHAIYPESGRGAVDLFGMESTFALYLKAKENFRASERVVRQYENEIKERLGASESGSVGRYTAVWKNQTRNSFDVRQFSEDHPDVDLAPYYKTSTFRRFTVKETE